MPERNNRKTKEAKVLSNKMHKTVVVEVTRTIQHPRFGKVIRIKKKIKAHDEENLCKVGDTVIIMETRPISKDKKWRVVEIVGHKTTAELSGGKK